MGYSTYLTDKQWQLTETIFKSKKGQLSKHPKRDLTDSVLYLVKAGCQWKLFPKDFTSHNAVWSFYRRAVKSGKREKAMDTCLCKFRSQTYRFSALIKRCHNPKHMTNRFRCRSNKNRSTRRTYQRL